MPHKWTFRHTSLCVKLAISSSGKLLWEWLVNSAQENIYKEIEFDLIKFNQWVAKRRKTPYDPRTLKRAANELVEKGIVIDLAPNRYKWNWRRWKFKDIFQKSADKPCLNRSHSADLTPSNPHSPKAGALTTTTNPTLKDEVVAHIKGLAQCQEAMSDLEESVEACQKAGITFTPEVAIQTLSWHTVEEVKSAIAYTLKRARENPAGYLRVVLENEYWKRPARTSLVDVFQLISSVLRL